MLFISLREVALRLLRDDAYVFSVAAEGYEKIVACRAKDSSDAIGKSVYKQLAMTCDEEEFFQREFCAIGKRMIVARGGNKAVLFVKHFAYATGLCLAVALDLPLESGSVIMRERLFEDFAVSEGVIGFAPAQRRFSMAEDRLAYEYLTETVGLLDSLTSLKLQRDIESVGTLKSIFDRVGELVGVKTECVIGEANDEEFYFARPEIFDGRFCAACFLTLSMAARMHARDRRLACEIVGGLDSLFLKFRFEPFDEGWRDVVERLRTIALGRHGMEFDFEIKDGAVAIECSPFYAYIAFVGVKQGDGFVGIEELGELY